MAAHAADIIRTVHTAAVCAACDCAVSIEAAHAADIIRRTCHTAAVCTVCDCTGIIVAAHAANMIFSFEIGIFHGHITNFCTGFSLSEQTDTILLCIIKIQSADGMSLSIKCAVVVNIFLIDIAVTVIAITDREPITEIALCESTVLVQDVFIYGNVRCKNGICFSITSIYMLHEPVELTCICDLVHAVPVSISCRLILTAAITETVCIGIAYVIIRIECLIILSFAGVTDHTIRTSCFTASMFTFNKGCAVINVFCRHIKLVIHHSYSCAFSTGCNLPSIKNIPFIR